MGRHTGLLRSIGKAGSRYGGAADAGLWRVWNVEQDVFYLAGKNVAQVIQGGGGDIPVVLQRVQGAPAEGVVLDQPVGCDSLAFHGLPKRVVYDHGVHLPMPSLLYFLTGGLNIPDISGIMNLDDTDCTKIQ